MPSTKVTLVPSIAGRVSGSAALLGAELEEETEDSEELVREREEDEGDASALEEAAEALLLLPPLPQEASKSMEAAKANKLMCFIKPPMVFYQ